MTGNAPTHTCSYFCDKPECIKAQRDELREKLAAIRSQPAPVEPEIPTVYYVTIPTGEYASVVTTASLSKWRAYINTMQSALKLAAYLVNHAEAIRNLVVAAEKAQEAMMVWTNTYAPEMCDPEGVKKSQELLNEGGTLYYIATVSQSLSEALAKLDEA